MSYRCSSHQNWYFSICPTFLLASSPSFDGKSRQTATTTSLPSWFIASWFIPSYHPQVSSQMAGNCPLNAGDSMCIHIYILYQGKPSINGDFPLPCLITGGVVSLTLALPRTFKILDTAKNIDVLCFVSLGSYNISPSKLKNRTNHFSTSQFTQV